MRKSIFAADIGGTNSRFAHFELIDGAEPIMKDSIWLSSPGAKSFEELLMQLSQTEFSLKIQDASLAVFAVAGPVENGNYSKPPLISWDIDFKRLAQNQRTAKMFLINDFVAQAFATRSPAGREAERILSGDFVEHAATAVVGAGTGFGKAILAYDHGRYFAVPSEGGHVNFCPEDEEEFAFQKFVQQKIKQGFVTWNDVVSGSGLSLIHEFCTGESLVPAEVAQKFSPESKTLALASRFYGRVARNFALECVAFGGVFIAGGIAAKNPQLVKHPEFEGAFRKSRLHSKLLAKIPVSLVTSQDSGLWGAAYYGCQEL